MKPDETRKPGRHYYEKLGYEKSVLICLKKNTHAKLVRNAKERELTLQDYIRAVLEDV